MKYFIALLVVMTLISCENKKSADGLDHSAERPVSPQPQTQKNTEIPPTAQPPPSTQQAVPPSNPETPQPIEPTPVNSLLPEIRFSNYNVVFNRKLEAQLELELSQPSNVPVVVDVYLLNGTALHYRDFAGFKARNEMKQTIIFAPGETHRQLPVIGGRSTENCDSIFYVQMDKSSVQKAQIINFEAQVRILCY